MSWQKRFVGTVLTVFILALLYLVFPSGSSFSFPTPSLPTASDAGPKTAGTLNAPSPEAYERSYLPGQVLVRFRDKAGDQAVSEMRATAGVRSILREINTPRGEKAYLMELEPGVSVESAVERLRSSGQVAYAEPNYLRRLAYTPGDPDFPLQWGFQNNGQEVLGSPGIPGADIGAVQAWDLERGYRHAVTVAVIDSGMDLAHPDLSGKLWLNDGEVPDNGIDDDGNGYVDDFRGYNFAGISQYQVNRNPWGLGSGPEFQRLAQSIKGTGCILTHIGLLFAKAGEPSQDVTVSVRNNLNGLDLASFAVSAGELSSTEVREIYRPLSNPVKLNQGGDYYIVVSTNQNDTANFYWLYDLWDAGDWYAEGSEYQLKDGSWVNHSNGDFCFETNRNAVAHDDNGHGTHCCGIVGAETGNNLGVAGTSPGAVIMPLKASDCGGLLADADWISALYYAVVNGADVVSMSFGGETPSEAEMEAVEYAWRAGVTLVASVGNSGDATVLYPAGYDRVLGVGATDNQDMVATFSNHNSSVDVVAPGVAIYSTTPSYPVGLTHLGLVPNYGYISGTSMSCPMAVGAAALVLSRNPSYGEEAVRQAIQANADDKGDAGRDDYYGWGRLNAYRALSAVPPLPRIDGITPDRGKDETEVALVGSGFGAERSEGRVFFGSVEAVEYLFWSDSEIRCTVPAGAWGRVEVTVTTVGGTSNAVTFTAIPTLYFAEGYTGAGFEEWLCLQNPNPDPTTAHITYMFADGTTQTQDVGIGPTTRATVDVNSVVGPEKDVSISIVSDHPIVAERPMYFNYKGAWTGGHDVVGFYP